MTPLSLILWFSPGCFPCKEECYILLYRNKRRLFLYFNQSKVFLRPQIFSIHHFLKVCHSRARGSSVGEQQKGSGTQNGKLPEGLTFVSPKLRPPSGLLQLVPPLARTLHRKTWQLLTLFSPASLTHTGNTTQLAHSADFRSPTPAAV